MHDSSNQKYTVGFIFDAELKRVLLVHKKSPEWMKGKVNGVGGKYEPRETTAACIRRETREETTLDIPDSEWIYAGTIYQQQGNVGILATRYPRQTTDAKANAHEDIEWFPIDALPQNVMSNLRWIIPLCIQKIQGEFNEFSIQY